MDKKTLLEWYLLAGVDETTGEAPHSFFEAPAVSLPAAQPLEEPAPMRPAMPTGAVALPSAAAQTARTLADQCHTLAELEAAVRAFDGCPLKKTASKTVFADGNPESGLMLIGEAPGAQEDVQGIPFCGPSGELLNRMFASIGFSRNQLYITNTVFWRPPGNRQPTPEEMLVCQPLVEKHIALVKPKLLVLCGGVATTAVLGKDSALSRLRGRTYDYTNPYLQAPVMVGVTYHPSYLLRSPAQKKLAWQDLQFFAKLLRGQ
jgi:uracil-DNA glycosylase family 4